MTPSILTAAMTPQELERMKREELVMEIRRSEQFFELLPASLAVTSILALLATAVWAVLARRGVLPGVRHMLADSGTQRADGPEGPTEAERGD